MAGSAILKIDVLTDATKAVKGLNDVGTAATKQSKSVTSFGSKSKTAFTGVTTSLAGMALGGLGAATAIAGLGSVLVDASKAAMEDEKSQALLAKAMENNLDATDKQIASMEDFIDKTARAVGVADDELRPALQNLIIAGQSAAEAQDTLGVALDIAAAKGLDVETVTKALAKAYQGNVAGLAKLGIQVRDADGDLVSFEEALDNAAETMGGSAATAAATLEGRMKRAKIAIDEAKESLGGWLNLRFAEAIAGIEFLDASMAGATKGNELFAIGIQGMRGALKKADDDVNALAGALIFAADKGAEPTTKAFKQQTKQMNLTLGETRQLSDKLGELAASGDITRESAYELMGVLNDQATAMESTREDGRLLTERYQGLATDADKAAGESSGVPQGAEEAGRRDPQTDRPGVRVAGRPTGIQRGLPTVVGAGVSGKATADDLRDAEDDLVEAHLDLKDAEDDVEKSAGKMEDAFNDARAEVGLLTDDDVEVERRHRPVVRRGEQRPPLASGHRHQRRSSAGDVRRSGVRRGHVHGGGGGT